MTKDQTYAVINTGGKQYRVREGDKLRVELLEGESEGEITFSDVLLLHEDGKTKVGTPNVSGAKVSGTIVEKVRDDKIIVFKKKRRKGYKRLTGHRQDKILVSIDKISGKAKAAPKKKTAGTAK